MHKQVNIELFRQHKRVCCVNCFESNHIYLEKCVKSIEKTCNMKIIVIIVILFIKLLLMYYIFYY